SLVGFSPTVSVAVSSVIGSATGSPAVTTPASADTWLLGSSRWGVASAAFCNGVSADSVPMVCLSEIVCCRVSVPFHREKSVMPSMRDRFAVAIVFGAAFIVSA
ncbi:MAG: hypothetical protein RR900_02950, partial [Ruthenibacterium sp.]